jgi:aldose 1-epimerase
MEIKNPTFFGFAPDGEKAEKYRLRNGNGAEMSVINYGATITSLIIPTDQGLIDVVLGFDSVEDYVSSINLPAPPHFGAAIGRWAGRINKGKFSLNGKDYELRQNNGGHSLHGGRFGFSQSVWDLKQIATEDNPSITFSYFSPDGDENFPGNLNVEVTYTLSEENELVVDYWAQADDDTIVNLTQHSYFNLDGHKGSIADQDLYINAGQLLETNGMIPTGEFLDAPETPFDFREAKRCPQNVDATFVLKKNRQPAAILSSSRTNLKMTVTTDQPAVHIYVGGDCFGKIKGKDGAEYHPLSGICFETQNFPDAPNHPNFPNPILKKGDEYKQKTIFKFERL